MGYRSDAALATRRKYYDEMLRTAKTQDYSDEILYFLTRYADCSISKDDRGENTVVILRWKYVKWYNDFHEIAYVERWMDGEFDREFEYSFLRIGEDPDDTEIRCDENYSLDGVLTLAREIYVDADTTMFIPEIPDDPPQDDADLPEGTDFSISDFLNIKEDL